MNPFLMTGPLSAISMYVNAEKQRQQQDQLHKESIEHQLALEKLRIQVRRQEQQQQADEQRKLSMDLRDMDTIIQSWPLVIPAVSILSEFSQLSPKPLRVLIVPPKHTDASDGASLATSYATLTNVVAERLEAFFGSNYPLFSSPRPVVVNGAAWKSPTLRGHDAISILRHRLRSEAMLILELTPGSDGLRTHVGYWSGGMGEQQEQYIYSLVREPIPLLELLQEQGKKRAERWPTVQQGLLERGWTHEQIATKFKFEMQQHENYLENQQLADLGEDFQLPYRTDNKSARPVYDAIANLLCFVAAWYADMHHLLHGAQPDQIPPLSPSILPELLGQDGSLSRSLIEPMLPEFVQSFQPVYAVLREEQPVRAPFLALQLAESLNSLPDPYSAAKQNLIDFAIDSHLMSLGQSVPKGSRDAFGRLEQFVVQQPEISPLTNNFVQHPLIAQGAPKNIADGRGLVALATGKAPLVVSSHGNNCYATIEDAIDAAWAGATILIEPGSYQEDLTIIDEELKLAAHGDDEPIVIEGSLSILGGRVAIDGITLHGNGSTELIEIWEAEATLSNCVLDGKTTTGVNVTGAKSRVTLSHCTIRNCHPYGIEFDSESHGMIDNCDFQDNKVGVRIRPDCDVSIQSTSFGPHGLAGLVFYPESRGRIERCDFRRTSYGYFSKLGGSAMPLENRPSLDWRRNTPIATWSVWEIVQKYKKIAQENGFTGVYFRPNLPENILTPAASACNIANPQAKVLAVFDLTMIGDGTQGVILGWGGIWVKTHGEKKSRYIFYSNFPGHSFVLDNGVAQIRKSGSVVSHLAGLHFGWQDWLLINLLNEIKAAM